MKELHDISLKAYNTFGIDVRARRMLELESESDLAALPAVLERRHPAGKGEEERYIILGGGSNMVFTRDFEGTVLRLATRAEAHVEADGTVAAWGGMVLDDLVAWCLAQGLYGMENLTAIPGTVGASVVQNVGAYGCEAKDVVASVEAYDMVERRPVTFSAEDCRFGYRDSMFKHSFCRRDAGAPCAGRYLVTRVRFRLQREFVPNLSYKALEAVVDPTPQGLRDAIAALRWSKLPRPEEHGSAGSFFKNPIVDEATYQRLRDEYPDMPVYPGNKLSAGWLIDRAGWKGRTQGGAGVWPRQALVLYNTGRCTGPEVVALAQAIQHDVYNKFGVHLAPEAIII